MHTHSYKYIYTNMQIQTPDSMAGLFSSLSLSLLVCTSCRNTLISRNLTTWREGGREGGRKGVSEKGREEEKKNGKQERYSHLQGLLFSGGGGGCGGAVPLPCY